MSGITRSLVVVAAVLAATLAFAVSSDPVAAQETCLPNDPYGCNATTVPSGVLGAVVPACQVSVSSARSGERVEVTITNVPSGSSLELQLNGTVVATGRAAATTAAAEAGVSDVTMAFVVPVLAPGNYSLVAVGPAFRCECLPGQGFAVLAAQTTHAATGSVAATSPGPASGSRSSWRSPSCS